MAKRKEELPCTKLSKLLDLFTGTSVNMGKKAGVAAKLKEDTPWPIDIHCPPHPLELAMLELQRSCATVKRCTPPSLMEDMPH